MTLNFIRYVNIAFFLVAFLGAVHHNALGQGLKWGDEVFAVEPNLVLEVSYRTWTHKVIAYRWDVGEKFTIFSAQKEGRKHNACIGGENLDFILRQFTSLKFRREIDALSAETYLRVNPMRSWAELVIRDNSELEPFQAMISRVEGSSNEALIRIGSSTYVVAIERRAFDLIANGCKSLAASNVRVR
jgi:hypothetical protein